MTDLSKHRTLSQPAASTESDIDEINAALDRRFRRERAMGAHSTFNGNGGSNSTDWILIR